MLEAFHASLEYKVAPITGEERTQELARMLGGEHISAATLAHAQELLGQAAPAPPRPAGRRGARA